MTDRGTRWRCFVAVPLDERLRDELVAATGPWRERPDLSPLRWADPAAWHLTLAFLGPTDPAAVPGIVRSLQEVAHESAGPTITTGGVGGFPSTRRARVAWYGAADDGTRLRSLAVSLRAALGVEPGPFLPHITLARTRGRAEIDLSAWVRDAQPPAGWLQVDRLELMRSELGRGPARYESLASVRLGAPTHV